VSKARRAAHKPAAERRKKGISNKLQAGLRLIPISLAEEIKHGDSLAEKLLQELQGSGLAFATGDILVVKHKIVSKSEGCIVDLATIKPSPESFAWGKQYRLDARVIELALRESRAVIRRKNGVLITETQHGFVCANSGVDVSNVDGGKTAVLLPVDPDRSAAQIHRKLKKRTGLHIPVIIADSFGRAWREGLYEVAIGVAGMKVIHDYRGKSDPYGYKMHATEEAVADELACVAGLVCGKDSRIPACIIRGYQYRRGGGSARQLVRPAAKDLFR